MQEAVRKCEYVEDQEAVKRWWCRYRSFQTFIQRVQPCGKGLTGYGCFFKHFIWQ